MCELFAEYSLSFDRGFLSSFDPANVTLPEFLHPVRDVALALPRILPTGRVRAHLQSLPACLAVPIWQIGKATGQPPLLPHSSYTLENWGRFDPTGPIDLSNIYTIQHFDGGLDEAQAHLLPV
ncbi:MAG: hypothetical protein JJ954_12025 [Hyphomonas sp.]|uniref:hypothetical protein n=1 Tax=unclassified Hyphomonas TaxID=2630699 RepID=UPI000C4EF94B|nr:MULTISPECIES: hypothetical protein [unclassified Hyphomonas]MAN92102.1 hypothetical protein [Hyphomonadaceae bacterium]MAA83238.1 hypothetical protein [Hyphomonas sp.]MBO6583673.1 hypothetical protein [Hyphomonas sp.]HBL93283.1 hypothetical protein [Hyphomonas sp.]HCN92093.1 hypothetical protein [Hyphomonas sp.]|tara:strand:- start:9006 stop:9374 length:369 start_codon:yes stop_codon:yes gene_type:complete